MSKTNYGVDIDDIVQKMMISISNLISCITFKLTLTTSTQNYDIESKIGCIIFRLSISLTKWRYRYRRYWQQGSETPQIRHLCKMMREFYDDEMILIRHRRYQHKVWMCRVSVYAMRLKLHYKKLYTVSSCSLLTRICNVDVMLYISKKAFLERWPNSSKIWHVCDLSSKADIYFYKLYHNETLSKQRSLMCRKPKVTPCNISSRPSS